jgi:hypothetical protein
MNRIVYPVYTRIGTHPKLCSSITFDSSDQGWRPIIFEDSNLIAPFLTDRSKAAESASYAMIEMPFIRDNVVIKRDANGERIIPTKELRNELGEDFPRPITASSSPLEPVDGKRFVDGLVHHMKLVELRRVR